MPMSGANMSNSMFSIASGYGWTGSNLKNMSDALSNGTINNMLGAPFQTTDTGTVIGPGVGTGVGLLGVIASVVSLAIFNAAVAKFGSAGDDLLDLTDAVAQAFVAEIALATLSSTHTPVFLGSGTIVPGSIVVIAAAIVAAIQLEGIGYGFLGDNWPDFAEVVGEELANSLAIATGNLVITGAAVIPPPPAPGVGVGAGNMS